MWTCWDDAAAYLFDTVYTVAKHVDGDWQLLWGQSVRSTAPPMALTWDPGQKSHHQRTGVGVRLLLRVSDP